MPPLTCTLEILIVDDGSHETHQSQSFSANPDIVHAIRVLRLRRNLGHQRAIAIGLVFIAKAMVFDAVLIMDADGEDTPEGAATLIRAFCEIPEGKKHAIFAARGRRTESRMFRVFYWLYKIIHRLLAGFSVRVGNFSILPASNLETLVVMSEMWNHYAAAVFRSGLPLTTIPISRGFRLCGTSKMNFVSLAAHGISAISVFGDVVGVRLLLASILAAVVAFGAIFGAVFVRPSPVPSWLPYVVASLVAVLFQFVAIAATFTFTMLANRMSLNFVPLRDYELFIAKVDVVYEGGSA
jgi:hypothetical protein